MIRIFTRFKGRLLAGVILAAIGTTQAISQTTLDYKATDGINTTGTYTDLGTTGTPIAVANNDNANSAVLPIGFTFNFNRTNFTDFPLNTNGFIKLGTTPISSQNVWRDIYNSPGYKPDRPPYRSTIYFQLPINPLTQPNSGWLQRVRPRTG